MERLAVDLDVILAAHGAGNGSRANELVNACARRLEASLTGVRVTAAFHHGAPSFADALLSADRARRLVVPLLASDGYYAARMRREVERAAVTGTAPIMLAPVGTQRAFVRALAHRVARHIVEHGLAPARTIAVVVGHGTLRHPGSGRAARSLAQAITRVSGVTAHAAYLDESPLLEDVIRRVPLDASLVVVPLLVGGGDHAENDVPARVRAGARGRGVPDDCVVILESMGGLPTLSGILERIVRVASGERVLTGVRR